jgi:hypothetical protein
VEFLLYKVLIRLYIIGTAQTTRLFMENFKKNTQQSFANSLGESLPNYLIRILGEKEAKRGWRGIYRDGHSVSPKNAHRNLCRTSPLHVRTGWGGNSTAQCKENLLIRPDSLTRSGADAPRNGQLISFNRWQRTRHHCRFRHDPLSFGAYAWWTASQHEISHAVYRT